MAAIIEKKEEEATEAIISSGVEKELKQWEICCQRARVGLMWLMKDGDDIKSATERWIANAREGLMSLSRLDDSLKSAQQAVSPATNEGLDVRHAIHDLRLYLTDHYAWANTARQTGDLAFSLDTAIKSLLTHIQLQLNPGEEDAITLLWLPRHRTRITGMLRDLTILILRLRELTVAMNGQAQQLGAHPCVARLMAADEQHQKQKPTGLSWHTSALSMDELLRSLTNNLSLARLCGLREDKEPDDVLVTEAKAAEPEKDNAKEDEQHNKEKKEEVALRQPAEEWLRQAEANRQNADSVSYTSVSVVLL